MNIQIVYALPNKQILLNIVIKQKTTVKEAILQSGILSIRNDIDLNKNKVGIFSKITKLSKVLSNGDRIEIYRPLLADPKEIRRKREKNIT
ncbi:RnfH family protein [Arsenophonus endosymbiont of Lipoptena cervi]|uniref:RnfH family protein n=1 Tax=Arsenophonus endosymbiont of Lipoptena cervi TaxID=363258 RepID=UPI00376F220F